MTTLCFVAVAFLVAPRFMLMVTAALFAMLVWLPCRLVRRLGGVQ